jgi:hypothetical protein
VESERDLATRAQDDCRFAWPSFEVALHDAKVVLLATVAVISAIAMLDLLVAQRALGMFG